MQNYVSRVKPASFLGEWLNLAALPAQFPLRLRCESGPGFSELRPELRFLRWFALLLLRRRRIWRCGNLGSLLHTLLGFSFAVRINFLALFLHEAAIGG